MMPLQRLPSATDRREWLIRSRIERGDHGLFRLEPLTGKTHQLRLHMQQIGSHIIEDRFYPEFQPPSDPPDYASPLQLLARDLCFRHPTSGTTMHFCSRQSLQW
jgi:tRNA pseudouridine32 synthase/23S rRNA pseudouridine746 synthase